MTDAQPLSDEELAKAREILADAAVQIIGAKIARQLLATIADLQIQLKELSEDYLTLFNEKQVWANKALDLDATIDVLREKVAVVRELREYDAKDIAALKAERDALRNEVAELKADKADLISQLPSNTKWGKP